MKKLAVAFWGGKMYKGLVGIWGDSVSRSDERMTSYISLQGDGSWRGSLNERSEGLLPLAYLDPSYSLVGKRIRRQNPERPHPMNPGTPVLSPTVENYLGWPTVEVLVIQWSVSRAPGTHIPKYITLTMVYKYVRLMHPSINNPTSMDVPQLLNLEHFMMFDMVFIRTKKKQEAT